MKHFKNFQQFLTLFALFKLLLCDIRKVEEHNQLADITYLKTVYQSTEFFEQEISYQRAKIAFMNISPLSEKHNIEFISKLDKDFFLDLPEDGRKKNCDICRKQFQNTSFTQLHYLRKHFKFDIYQEQFLLYENAYKFAKTDPSHSEATFRKCLRYVNTYMDNDLETDDFCLDLLYGKKDVSENWKELMSSFASSVSLILFIAGTGFYYYLIYFKLGNKKEEHQHQQFGSFE